MQIEPIRPSGRHRPRRNAGERARNALEKMMDGRGCVLRHRETDWASISFAGTRHRFDLRFEGEAAIAVAEEMIAELPDHEFTIPGQLVAEARVCEVDHQMHPPVLLMSCELLLLEEA
ncbi:hypothetical protein GRI97_06370 [Altererythrobacter xixiisoli]|uniref:Uncharacterized protein n=1 Tax=Croceibacterium xixiisoli TaxID=1476466 RepID=A0A6I4TTZ0_9SPHN|nr:hypothetical protein [Croceibacterium xixiisoli]MXO98611.1 hypothetical protein [Croceibacterium xixiisoli]